LHSSAWFYAGLITSYKQTAKPRNSDVEGTAQGHYLRGWGLSVLKRGTRHSSNVLKSSLKFKDRVINVRCTNSIKA
jgi:hypothetical protein